MDDSNIEEEVDRFKMAIENIIRDPVYSYFAYNKNSGKSICLAGGSCGVTVKGENTTNLKYHLREKHTEEYVHMMSKCEKRDALIPQFFEFKSEIGKSKCKNCSALIKGKNLHAMKLHLHKHFKEKDELIEVELIPQPTNYLTKLQQITPPKRSNSVQPKPAKESKVRKRCPIIDVSSPLLKEPFKEGWKRELVYRACSSTTHPKKQILCDVYYFTPKGEKLRSGPDVLRYLNKVKSPLTLKNFTFVKDLIGAGSQETVRNASPKSYKLSNSETAKVAVYKMKLQVLTGKLRRNAMKQTATKAREEKRKSKRDQALGIREEKRKSTKDQALFIRQKKLLNKLLEFGVNIKATTLPLNLPLTAPIYLPLGATLVFSDPTSIEIKYSDSCAAVKQGPPDSSTNAAADVSAFVPDESNMGEQRKNHTPAASSSCLVAPPCSTSVTSQTAISRPVGKAKRYQNLARFSQSRSSLKTPSSFLEHLELIAKGKPFYLPPTTLSEDSMPAQSVLVSSSSVHEFHGSTIQHLQ